MSSKQQIIYNAIANMLSKSTRVLEQLIVVPFFLKEWGPAYYGEWITLTIIPSILAFSDLGFGSAASNSFVLTYASGDKAKSANIYRSALFIISCTIVLGLILSTVILFSTFKLGGFENSLIETKVAIISVGVLMLVRLFSFFNQLFEAQYRAARKAALSTNLMSVNSVLKITVGIIVLYNKGGVFEFAISQAITELAFITFYCTYGSSLIKDLPKGNINKICIKEITSKGLGFLMTPIWQSIYFQGSTFAVRLTIGAEGVAVFNTVRTVCRSANQLFSIINGSVFPELQLEYGQGNMIKVRRIYEIAIQTTFFIGIISCIFLYTCGSFLYNWWTQNSLTVEGSIWNIFITGILFNGIWCTASTVFRVVNKPYKFAIFGLISAALSTLSIYILSEKLGLLGASIGYVIMDVIMAMLVIPESCKMIQLKLSSIIKRNTYPNIK